MINPLVFITILGGVLDALALQVTEAYYTEHLYPLHGWLLGWLDAVCSSGGAA